MCGSPQAVSFGGAHPAEECPATGMDGFSPEAIERIFNLREFAWDIRHPARYRLKDPAMDVASDQDCDDADHSPVQG